jgi:hypothetical protein
MKQYRILLVLSLLLVAAAERGQAQVKNVEMKIAGYLCGN